MCGISKYHYFILFYCWLVFHNIDIPQCVHLCTTWWAFGSFAVSSYSDKAELHEYWCTTLWVRMCFHFSSKIPRIGITGSGSKCTSSFINPAELFCKCLSCFASPPAARENSTCSVSLATLGTFSLLNFHHPSGCEEVYHYGFNLHSSKG